MTDTLERVSEGFNSEMDKENLRDEFMDDFEDFRELLEDGDIRAAERNENSEWETNPRVKEGILLAFKLGENVPFEGGYMEFQDKDTLPPQEELEDARVVPGGSSVRSGAYVGDIIQMPPSYINVGAYVEDDTMVDSLALVGSAAQVGEDAHISTGAKLGGVLEPVGQSPVVIEDNVFLGGNSGVYEGTTVRENAVIAPNVALTSGTTIYDEVQDTSYSAEFDEDGNLEDPLEVPENAVVVNGAVEHGEADGRTTYIEAPIVVKYRDESTEASTALEEHLR